ncbi:DUF1934 domain-containing protein [Paenibacillus farraposensis]|uniref:DUF1934 domain-containing protein n=1 Tax=Paenibacillus farraposensis TaxID=2807095 RepID=A0ABW4DFA0_9BACL|nr:DUF1934 domain-containing protein [Paenibacillus farraposensis]MCC3378043.1 DUF1934 domain-containing protein [Paenibacillus farraposensis]
MEFEHMPHIAKVQIRLHSRHDGEDVVQELPGEAIVRGKHLYIRYDEPLEGPQGGTTRNTVKIGPDELKLIRHGEVQSEQSFALGRRLPGFYRSPYLNLNMSAHTQKLDIQMDGYSGHVSWAYDLYVFEDFSGHFAISLHIQEEQQS